MAVQCKNSDVTFDTSTTCSATNADLIPVGTAVPGELLLEPVITE